MMRHSKLSVRSLDTARRPVSNPCWAGADVRCCGANHALTKGLLRD